MLSIIIPSFNEEKMVPIAAKEISAVMTGAGIPFQLIFVDDGSRDSTWEQILSQGKNDSRITGVHFSRNFGKEAAIFAGLSHAQGDCCAVIDCDLQHPPEKLVEMYHLWEQGYEVVEGVKESATGRDGGVAHDLFAGLFYRLISSATKLDMKNSSDFKLLDRKVVDTLNQMPERSTFFRALSFWVGFKRTTVSYQVRERVCGTTKWSPLALIRYALLNIASFSSAPMQIVLWLGIGSLLLGLILAIQTLIQKLSGLALEGFTTVILVQLLGFGIVMVSLGIIGFYIARIYDEIKGRPRYIVAATCNLTGSEDTSHA